MRPGVALEMDVRSHQDKLKGVEEKEGTAATRALKDIKHGQRLVQGIV